MQKFVRKYCMYGAFQPICYKGCSNLDNNLKSITSYNWDCSSKQYSIIKGTRISMCKYDRWFHICKRKIHPRGFFYPVNSCNSYWESINNKRMNFVRQESIFVCFMNL